MQQTLTSAILYSLSHAILLQNHLTDQETMAQKDKEISLGFEANSG